jgi:tetratricopeptide (TPR) repeat protein
LSNGIGQVIVVGSEVTMGRSVYSTSAVTLALSAALAAGGLAQRGGHETQSLGTVRFPVSCAASVQPAFNRAVALLHHMTYPEARAAFEHIAGRDSQCAMAHWGIAMTLFQPLWPTRPNVDERKRGFNEATRALSMAKTPRESLFAVSVVEFFRDPESNDYWPRVQRWASALDKVHTAYPRDPEASAFDALALLASVPPSEVTSPNQTRAVELLLDVYKTNPDHPGAMHYIVHANDVPGREREQLAIVRMYAKAAPRNPHALHMPTHIYTRLGEWNDVIDGNLRAASAALDIPAGDRGQFVWDEFPHAVEYLVYAYLQQGANDKALAQITRLNSTPRLQPSFKTAFHLASTKARYALERHAWNEAAALAPREPASLDWDRFPWAEGVTWFARGLVAAHLGRVEDARGAATRLDTLAAHARAAGEDLFGRTIDILALGVRAWLAQAEHDSTNAVTLMQRAADLEAATPKHAVTPAPTIPAQELLGDLFLEQGRLADARVAYARALELYPNRRNSLRGASRARAVAPR